MSQSFLRTITGSFSKPAGENPTVAMMEAAYRALGLDAIYVNCEVPAEQLGDAVRGAVAMGWRGFNCSLPHKVSVIKYLDSLADSARVIGAVNCVVLRDGRLLGENTDGQGFLESLRTITDPRGSRVVILGAGGAARAIAVELALAGASHLTIVNRGVERGVELATVVDAQTPATATYQPWQGDFEVPRETDVVVNATSIGLHPDVSTPAVHFDRLTTPAVVADVIPNPPRTAFLTKAAEAGHTTLDGLGMLVNQGRIGIRLWFGEAGDPEVMRTALAAVLD